MAMEKILAAPPHRVSPMREQITISGKMIRVRQAGAPGEAPPPPRVFGVVKVEGGGDRPVNLPFGDPATVGLPGLPQDGAFAALRQAAAAGGPIAANAGALDLGGLAIDVKPKVMDLQRMMAAQLAIPMREIAVAQPMPVMAPLPMAAPAPAPAPLVPPPVPRQPPAADPGVMAKLLELVRKAMAGLGHAPAPAPAPIADFGGQPAPQNADNAANVGRIEDAEYQRRVLELVNAERAKVGAPPVRLDDAFNGLALGHSQDMVKRNYFSHRSPEGEGPSERAVKARVAGTAAENIAMGQRSPEAAMQSWLESPGHKANILNPMWTRMGIGVDANKWTQVFG